MPAKPTPSRQIWPAPGTTWRVSPEQTGARRRRSARTIANATGGKLLSACTLARGLDASGCFFLSREVRDRGARMVISVGDVDAMVRWVNRDLEKVSKA